jgi:hypothetical protein
VATAETTEKELSAKDAETAAMPDTRKAEHKTVVEETGQMNLFSDEDF